MNLASHFPKLLGRGKVYELWDCMKANEVVRLVPVSFILSSFCNLAVLFPYTEIQK